MNDSPLNSLSSYSAFIAALLNRPTVEHSTITIWPESPYTAIAKGEAIFSNGCQLRMLEELDFEDQLIIFYSYEALRGEEQLYWYDRFPHPNNSQLASTFPHHKHVPPDIKHNRIPAPEISFNHPNLPFIIAEIESLS
jgi:hypothetical protein